MPLKVQNCQMFFRATKINN